MTEISIRIHAAITTMWARMKEERGQDLLEYALIGGFVAAAIVAVAVLVLNVAVSNMYNGIASCIDFNFAGDTECNPGP